MKEIDERIASVRKNREISKDIDRMYGEIDGASVDKKILNEIAVYLSNGMEEKDIATLLNVNEKELDAWKRMYPEVMGAFEIGAKAVTAKVMLTTTQLALGGRKVKKQQAVKVGDYDVDGNKVGEHIEIVEIWEELPPNYQACQDILSAKESDTWNKKKLLDAKEKEQKNVLDGLDEVKKLELFKMLSKDDERLN